MLIIIFILLLIIFIKINNNIEPFQFLKENNNFKPIIHINVNKKNVIVSLSTVDYNRCEELCRTTPNCNGFNYALNECTLYRNLKYVSFEHPRRKW